MIVAENVLKFINGEITWAQVEGLTEEQATRYMQMGTAYLQAGQFDRALEVFNCLAGVNPKDPDAHALVGSTYQAMEKPEQAIAAFGRALALNPKHIVALAGRGELRRKQGDAEGLSDLKRAAEIDPMGKTNAGKRAAQLVRALAFNKPVPKAGAAKR